MTLAPVPTLMCTASLFDADDEEEEEEERSRRKLSNADDGMERRRRLAESADPKKRPCHVMFNIIGTFTNCFNALTCRRKIRAMVLITTPPMSLL